MTDSNEPKKRGGRPLKDPVAGKRPNVTFRCRQDLHAKLQEEAKQNDKSVSEEIERRLENSFRDVEISVEAAQATFRKMQHNWFGSTAMFDNAVVYSKLFYRFLDTAMSLEQYTANKQRAKEIISAAGDDLIDHLFMSLAHQKEFDRVFSPINDGSGSGTTSFREMQLAFKMAEIQARVLSHLMPSEYTAKEIENMEWGDEENESNE